MYAPAPEIAPPVPEYVTATLTLSPALLRPNTENCWSPPTVSVVLLGSMTNWTSRFFLTFELPLTVELASVAVTVASAADVSAV